MLIYAKLASIFVVVAFTCCGHFWATMPISIVSTATISKTMNILENIDPYFNVPTSCRTFPIPECSIQLGDETDNFAVIHSAFMLSNERLSIA